MKHIKAGVLDIAYLEVGPADGTPVVLLHGFPYDVQAYEVVAKQLAGEGLRCFIPWLRGFGPTRFLSADTPRSGEQAALGSDLLSFLDALEIDKAVLGGYDWGGRAACVVAALWPERVLGLVSAGAGYSIQNIAQASKPADPEVEHQLWYQYYLHGERGRAGLAANREAFCRMLWRLWSPQWSFGDRTFAHTAQSFDNPDFVDVAVHSYRHRFGLVAGDPAYQHIETQLAAQPSIAVPSYVLEGGFDGVAPSAFWDKNAEHFTGDYQREVVPGIGHNFPQEAPDVFAEAVLAMAR